MVANVSSSNSKRRDDHITHVQCPNQGWLSTMELNMLKQPPHHALEAESSSKLYKRADVRLQGKVTSLPTRRERAYLVPVWWGRGVPRNEFFQGQKRFAVFCCHSNMPIGVVGPVEFGLVVHGCVLSFQTSHGSLQIVSSHKLRHFLRGVSEDVCRYIYI